MTEINETVISLSIPMQLPLSIIKIIWGIVFFLFVAPKHWYKTAPYISQFSVRFNIQVEIQSLRNSLYSVASLRRKNAFFFSLLSLFLAVIMQFIRFVFMKLFYLAPPVSQRYVYIHQFWRLPRIEQAIIGNSRFSMKSKMFE